VDTILIFFVRINLPNFVQYSNIDNIDKGTRENRSVGDKAQPTEAENIWPQSSDKCKKNLRV